VTAEPATFDGRIRDGDALLIVDVQHDFLPGGALGVRDGDAVIPVLAACLRRWRARGLPVLASRDWHPPDHCSFADRGGPWPRHGVAGTHGAAFHPGLGLPDDVPVVSKGTRRDHEAYSAFDGTPLNAWLRAAGVRRIVIGGLTTDYCVRQTVADAIAGGYQVVVLEDAVRAVDVRPGDGARALAEMRGRGAHVVHSEALT